MHMKMKLCGALAALALMGTLSGSTYAQEAQSAAGTSPPCPAMGPGMMQGWGAGTAGPGMMYGWGAGRGMMGPGMMYGWGAGRGMMGPGWMHGYYGPGSMLNLDESQQKKMAQIQEDLHKKHWGLMNKMGEEYAKLRDLYNKEMRDPEAIGKQLQRIYDLQRQMTVSSLEAQNRMEALLTPEQKKQLRSFNWPGGMMW